VDPAARARFNAAFDDAFYARYEAALTERVGEPIGFRLAETPVFFPLDLRDRCLEAGNAILAQLCDPTRLERMRDAVPPERRAPNESALPNIAALDFAIVRAENGRLEPRLVELQGFPSLLAFETLQRDVWEEQLQTVHGLEGPWSSWFNGLDRAGLIDLARRTILGTRAPQEVILLDLDPPNQKTACDFYASKTLFDIDAVCPTTLRKRGKRLFRRDASGRELAVERIYYRLVIDELERKNVELPFDLRDELEVEWVPHPNWFFIWSKYSMPFLDHPAVPRTRLVSELETIPPDLSENYVLKPLFSFAGGGVNLHPAPSDLAAIPSELRSAWCLQEKIEYAGALQAVDGGGVKVELRMMFLRPDDEPTLTAATNLCRLARGAMLGVDFNKDMTWVGSSIGIWRDGWDRAFA
jgi:hypothetical protein